MSTILDYALVPVVVGEGGREGGREGDDARRSPRSQSRARYEVPTAAAAFCPFYPPIEREWQGRGRTAAALRARRNSIPRWRMRRSVAASSLLFSSLLSDGFS